MTVKAASDYLPIRETVAATGQASVVETIRACHDSDTPIYPVGGGTSLGYGVPPSREGIGLALTGLDRVIDYPARDMTITVEAGITMQRLADALAEQRQRLPIDVPQAELATVGGVVVTNSNGPRWYGQGSVRDYVLGISAVDGCGRLFRGGGRVVKNVAGYDFCKLLTGSLGTLGVVTQVTLRLKPIPERTAINVCVPANLDEAESLLAAMVHSAVTPVAVELLGGPAWRDNGSALQDTEWGEENLCLAVVLEGTDAEVSWMVEQLSAEWGEQNAQHIRTLDEDSATQLFRELVEFPAASEAPLVLQASVVASRTTEFLAAVREVDPQVSIQSHAGNGVLIARFSEFPDAGLSKSLVGHLQPLAFAAQGNVVILSSATATEMTRRSVWGGLDVPYALMTDVKREFDPKNLLNPDRFIYE